MTINTILAIVVIVATLIFLGVCAYFYFRDKTLDDIRADVHQKFREAEKNPNFTKKGKQKMKWVLQQARRMLPNWAQVLITDAFLEKVVQKWYDAVEDFLDNGQLDKSNKDIETKEE